MYLHSNTLYENVSIIQSPTELLLNVKFSHKIDAPATLNVNPTLVNITEHRYATAHKFPLVLPLILDSHRSSNLDELTHSDE